MIGDIPEGISVHGEIFPVFLRHVVGYSDNLALLSSDPHVARDAETLVKDLDGLAGHEYIHLVANVLVGH